MRRSSVVLVVLSLSFSGSAIAAEAPAAAAAKEKLICKRSVETGSLVKAKKQCFTKAQWAARGEHAKTEAERMIGTAPGNQPGN